MDTTRVTLILNATDPATLPSTLPVRTGHFNPGGARPRTYSADAKNTAGGAKNVTVDFYGTDRDNPDPTTEYDWVKIGTAALVTDGANRTTQGFVSDDTYSSVKAVISAADAQATLVVNAYVSCGATK